MTERDMSPRYRGNGQKRDLIEPEWLQDLQRAYVAKLQEGMSVECDETSKDARRARTEAARDAATPLLEEYEEARQEYQANALAIEAAMRAALAEVPVLLAERAERIAQAERDALEEAVDSEPPPTSEFP